MDRRASVSNNCFLSIPVELFVTSPFLYTRRALVLSVAEENDYIIHPCFFFPPQPTGDKGVGRSRSVSGLARGGAGSDDDIHRILQQHQPDVDYELPSVNSSYAGKQKKASSLV